MSAKLIEEGINIVYPSCTAYNIYNIGITNLHGIQTTPCNKRSLPELHANITHYFIYIVILLQKSLEMKTDGGKSRTYYPRIASDA